MKLENLIRAEDFKDAVVFIQEKSVTIIVQTPALTALDKKSLAETAVRVTGLNVENIIIIPKM
jgi:stage III sporulation protein AH